MKLTYRGVNYESQNAPASFPVVDLKYRGATYRRAGIAQTQALNAILKYRGVAYNPNPQVEAEVVAEATPVATPAFSIDEQARQLGVNHHRSVKNRQQSMLSRSATEVGLAAGVSNYWNRIQGKIHPSFWATYDRSHATLS